MWTLFTQFLTAWNNNKNQRIRLQQAYFLLIILLATVSGFLSLLSATIGRALMLGAALLALLYVVNGITWALLDAFISPRIPNTARKK